MGEPGGHATVFGGAVVGGVMLSSGTTMVQVAAMRPLADAVRGALRCPRTPLSGTALVACANSVSLSIRL